MLKLLKSIWLGVTLIFLASALLLYSDRNRRQGARPAAKALPRVAVLQILATDLLDRTVAGMVEGLRQQGFENGRTADIRFFDASGDTATLNTLARELTGGRYDLVLTASTVAMQAVAKANQAGRVTHVFAAVTAPYGAGVGISGPKPDQHPPHLVGVGTFQPVEHGFRLARQMNPSLRRIGVVWDPGEANSEACVVKARAVCLKLGLELLEANAGNTSEVPEAIRAVLARGPDIIWVGGDNVAIAGLRAIVAAARTAKVPVFSHDPDDMPKGVLFALGASYQTVGRAVGEMAGKILHGTDPRTFGVEDFAPEVLALDETLVADLNGWFIPAEIRAAVTAATTAASAAADLAAVVASRPQPDRVYKVGVLYIGAHPIFELAIAGIVAALGDAGFVEGRNLQLQRVHPNSDMSMLPQVADQLAAADLDLVMPLSTPCLGVALARIKNAPLVFGIVSAPLEAGAGKSFTDHLPQVTGAVWSAPNPAMFRWLKTLYPECRSVGVIYNPAEANSRLESERARALLAEQGMTLVARTVSNPSEITQAAESLLAARVDVVFGMADNTVVGGFAGLAQACRKAHTPLLADDNSLMGSGALFTCGASPTGEGRQAGRLAARVLLGEKPAALPFLPSTDTETAVDLAAAAALGTALPGALLKDASVFHHASARLGRPFRLALVTLVQNPLLESAERGVLRGLGESGFREKEDYTVSHYNAQGEIAQLPAILDAARAEAPDAIVTFTTPALMAAAKRVTDIPVVFTIASDPVVLRLFTADTRPANLTGVHDDPPVARLLDMARRHDPALAAVGIVYDPAQPNSLISVEKLRLACRDRKITLHEATAATVSELPAAVQAVLQRQVGAIVLSADNLVCTGFPTIHRAAQSAGVPIYATDTDLARQGATGAIGDNYEAWGAQSGRLVAKVFAGVPPGELAIESTRVQEVIEPEAAAVAAPAPPATAPARPWEIRVVRYNDAQFSEDTWRGIQDGFNQQGLQAGRDVNVRCLNAQGDMTTLTTIMTAVRAERPDLIMPISTPALQAALRQADGLPIVFSTVGDGVQAGAGKSATDHLPNVTGITTRSPFTEMARLLRTSLPGIRAVGTLFCPAEISSELYRDWFGEALAKEGLELVAVPVNSSSETSEAASSLLRAKIQIVCQISDNLTRPAFSQIAKRADDANLPFFCFDSSGVSEGATLALARDFYETGREAAAVAVRVLRGAAPKDIPFANTRTEALVINPDLLAKFGITLPPELRQKAKVVTGSNP